MEIDICAKILQDPGKDLAKILVRFLTWVVFFHIQIYNVHLHVNKKSFHMKGFALGLTLKQRRKTTRKLVTDSGCSNEISAPSPLPSPRITLSSHMQKRYQQSQICPDFVGPQETVRNKKLSSLRADLCRKHEDLDGFCLYL